MTFRRLNEGLCTCVSDDDVLEEVVEGVHFVFCLINYNYNMLQLVWIKSDISHGLPD